LLEEQVRLQNRKDYSIAFTLAIVAYLLVLIPQYNTVEQVLATHVQIPESSVGSLVQSYGPILGVQLSIVFSLVAFLVISGILLLLTSRMGKARRSWRWKYMLTSMGFIGYVGYSLGIVFLTSLGWTSIIANTNVDVSAILQSYYLFNLGAAICYLGIVLVLRRTYTRLSALEAKDSLTIRKGILS
jgi:hypothetical protein